MIALPLPLVVCVMLILWAIGTVAFGSAGAAIAKDRGHAPGLGPMLLGFALHLTALMVILTARGS